MTWAGAQAARPLGHAPLDRLTHRPWPLPDWPGTLEHWLTERYCLYAQSADRSIWRNDVHHVPWPLQAAEASILQNTYLASHGLAVQGPPALLHFARRIDVVVWNGSRIA